MKRTIAFIVLLTVIGTGSPLSAQDADHEQDLQELYRQIDDAIDHSPEYVAKRLGQIADTQKALRAESSLEKRFALAEQLFEFYKPYKNDSALYMADLCISLADSMNRKDMVGLYLSRKAHKCSSSGLYVKALDLLKRVDRRALGREELTIYYAAWMHLCGELGSYAQLSEEQLSYYVLQDAYRDSVLAVANEGSEEFLHLARVAVNFFLGLFVRGFQVRNHVANAAHAVIQVVELDGRLLHLAFQVAVGVFVFGNQQLLFVNFDQASLFMLAECLCEDGDYERADRYVHFCEACNLAYSPQLRNYQVRYVANVMEAVCEYHKTRYARLMKIVCIGAVLLLGLVAWLLLRQKRRRPQA